MKYLVAVVVIILLFGCAGTRFEGRKSGAGQAEFSNDYLECQALAQRLVGPPQLLIFGGYTTDRTVFTCMQGKGWTMTSPKYD